MRLIISDIKLGELAFPNPADMMRDVLGCMRVKFEANKIIHKAGVNANGDLVFSFVPNEEPRDRLFLSSDKNIVPLKKDDPRAKKLKRDHLFTNRLTKKQSDLVWNVCINETLSKLGVACKISLQEFNDDVESTIILRDGYEWKDFPIKDKAYPQPKA